MVKIIVQLEIKQGKNIMKSLKFGIFGNAKEFLAELPSGLYHLSLASPQETRNLLKQGSNGVYAMQRVTMPMLQSAAFATDWNKRTKVPYSKRSKNIRTVFLYKIIDNSAIVDFLKTAGGENNPVTWFTVKKQLEKNGKLPRIHVLPVAKVAGVRINAGLNQEALLSRVIRKLFRATPLRRNFI